VRYAQSSAAAIRISIFDKGRELLDEDDDELRLEDELLRDDEELLTSELELLLNNNEELLEDELLTDTTELAINSTELLEDSEEEAIELLTSTEELLTATEELLTTTEELLTEVTELATGTTGAAPLPAPPLPPHPVNTNTRRNEPPLSIEQRNSRTKYLIIITFPMWIPHPDQLYAQQKQTLKTTANSAALKSKHSKTKVSSLPPAPQYQPHLFHNLVDNIDFQQT